MSRSSHSSSLSDPVRHTAASADSPADLTRVLVARTGVDEAAVRRVVSPYRICPVGAHVDHQGGSMLAMAVDAATELVFAASDSLDLESRNLPGRIRFDPGEVLAGREVPAQGSWGRYVYAALAALSDRLPIRPRGFTGILRGSLPGSGLSSSASVTLAYLMALANVNRIELSAEELVEAAVVAENEYVGVRCGVLDPAAIVGSRRGELLSIDAKRVAWRSVPVGDAASPVAFLALFTGTDRSLLATDFNRRVEECRAAAAWIAKRADRADAAETEAAPRLGDLDRALLRSLVHEVPGAPGLRARHFVEECDRVERAREAWARGDLATFGGIMHDSCRSSIENYETGSEELIALQQIWQQTPGVLGARFSGAGFGGCSIALVSRPALDSVAREVAARFEERFPSLGQRVRVLRLASHDGLAIR